MPVNPAILSGGSSRRAIRKAAVSPEAVPKRAFSCQRCGSSRGRFGSLCMSRRSNEWRQTTDSQLSGTRVIETRSPLTALIRRTLEMANDLSPENQRRGTQKVMVGGAVIGAILLIAGVAWVTAVAVIS